MKESKGNSKLKSITQKTKKQIRSFYLSVSNSLREVFLYNIIPKKRLLIAFIGFLISSTIITGAGVLLTSIVDSTSSYLGESSDVLVISSPEASTPYTSRLPLELADTISSIEGVEIVSPEVMTAAVYENKAVYFRGVDVSKFWELTEVDYLEGSLPSLTDSFEVSIGVNFAERNNLGLGDFITLFSTRSESALELKIKSIFKTDTLLDDEIIASLWIGQFFAFEDYDYVTHIRVKIDLDIVPNKELLRDVILSEYSVEIDIITPDSLTEVNATITVKTKRGELVNETILLNENQITFTLPFGEYRIQGGIEGVLSSTLSILLSKDTHINLDIPYKERLVTFHIITDEDEPIEGAIIKVYSQNITERYLESRNYQTISDSFGEASLIIGDGSYFAEITYYHYKKTILFTTTDVNDLEVILITRHPFIYVSNPANNSLVIGSLLNISLSATTGYSISFYYDGNIANSREYHIASGEEIYPNGIIMPFSDGSHSITVEAYNNDYIISGYDKSLNYATTTVYFTISSEIPSDLSFYNVMNGSQIEPNDLLLLNTTYKFNDRLKFSWDNQEFISFEENFLVAPYKIGIHRLTLQASADGLIKEIHYLFAVTETPFHIGTIGLREDLKIKSGEYIQTWFTPFHDAYFSWNSNPMTSLSMKGKVNTSSLSNGLNTLHLYTHTGVRWFNRTYDIQVDNTAPIISLSELNGTTVNSTEYLTFISNENLSQFQFAWDNFSYSIVYGNKIQIPEANGNHSLHIKAKDEVGNIIEMYYEYNISGFDELSTPYDFYLQEEYANTLNQTYIDIIPFVDSSYLRINYTIEGTSELSGDIIDSIRAYLFPGTYTLTIEVQIDFFESRTRTWTFTIADGFNSHEILLEDINDTTSHDMILDISFFDLSYNLTYFDSIFFTDGLYNISYSYPAISEENYQQTLIFDTIEPYLDVITPTLGFEGLSCILNVESDAAEVLFKFASEPTIYLYDTPETIIFTNGGEHSIIFFLTDTYGNTEIINYNYIVDLTCTLQELSFHITIGDELNPLESLSIAIGSFYNTSEINLNTDEDGRLNFTILEGIYYITFEYNSEDYDFVLNTNDGLSQDIWLNNAFTIVEVRDNFANSSIKGIYCIIRDKYGNRVMSSYTDSNGRIYTTNLNAGTYSFYFIGSGDGFAVRTQQIYLSDNLILFNIPSKKQLIVFEFQYDNGTQIFNLPVTITTVNEGSIITNTGLSSQVTLYLTYGFIDLSITLKNGSIINLRRIFEPGMTKISIVLQSETEDQWSKIPFTSISGFAFLVSLSFEYVDYYLQGSLLFTYTLAYAEVLLILIVVIVNMNSIIQNLYSESKRESAIVKMIGGTNLHAITAIFSRIGLVALISSIIGYGFGNLVLIILSSLNQTVFFGHTFIPKGTWLIFGLNVVLTMLIAIITTLIIARKAKDEKIVYLRRN